MTLTANGTTRYNEIKRIEYLGIPVRVEYSLTEKAVRLQPILLELIRKFGGLEDPLMTKREPASLQIPVYWLCIIGNQIRQSAVVSGKIVAR